MASHKQQRISLGLDIGGTRIKAVALSCSSPFEILATLSIPSNAKQGPEGVRAAVRAAIQEFEERRLEFQSIGVGCAGSVDATQGIVRNSPNFSFWKNVPLAQMITEDFGFYTYIENDANCAAYGEWKTGSAIGAHNVIMLTLGTGIGGGLILADRLYRGATGTAGELGHFVLYADGKDCPCGNRGCFERYCSGSSIREASGLSAKDFFHNASATDPTLAPILDRFIEDFTAGLTSIANIFDPEMIIVGGGVARGLEPFLKMIERQVKARCFPAVAARLRIVKATHDSLSGAIGAALLVRDLNE